MKVWIVGIIATALTTVAAGLIADGLTSVGTSVREIIDGDNRSVVIRDKHGPVLAVTVEQGDGDGCNAPGWVYPEPPSAPLMNTPPGTGPRKHGKTWDEDPLAFGAVAVGPVALYISAQARDNRAIILNNITFHVVERKPPLKGTRVSMAAGCGDSPTYHIGRVNFDTAPPYWVAVGDYMKEFRTDELKFPYKTTASDPATFYIEVDQGACMCKWQVELSWTDGSTSGKTLIDNDGKPFETTSAQGLTIFTWENGQRKVSDAWTS
ncbi:hypothetical protein [Streptomyces venetus]|uniref:hypothetical protein n=1 Tax=Streptomyces venetus TaxID=1701086 RepID=UPI003C2BA775